MPPQSTDSLSSQDLSELYQAQQHLAQAGDPRADQLRQYIATQGRQMLHPDDAQGVSTIGKIWDWANRGLVSKDVLVRAMSGMTPDQLNSALASYPEESPVHAAVREFTRGAVQDTAQTASSFTSPMALGTMAVGAAGQVPGKVGTAAKAITGASSALFGAEGAKQAVQNAPEALKGNPEAAQRALQGGAMAAGGAAGAAATIAPQLASAPIQEVPGRALDAARAGGESLTQGARTLGQKMLPSLIDGAPADMMTRAVKPKASNMRWNSDVQVALPQMKAAEAELGHPVQGLDDALDAAQFAKKQLWQQYEARLGPAARIGAVIDGNKVADAMVNAIDQRTASQNPALVEKVAKMADTYRRPLPLDEAEDYLQSANRDLTTYYAKNKVGQQVAQNDPNMSATVAEGQALRRQLYSRLDALSGPGAAQLKQQYGALTNIQNELQSRQNVAARQQPVSLAEQISTANGYGKIARGVLTFSPRDIAEGAETVGVAKFLKERQTTDAMIQRAFAKVQPAAPMAAPTMNEGYYNQLFQRPKLGLPAGPTQLAPPVEPSEPGGVFPAKSRVVRDPRTGRMRRMYLTSSQQ